MSDDEVNLAWLCDTRKKGNEKRGENGTEVRRVLEIVLLSSVS